MTRTTSRPSPTNVLQFPTVRPTLLSLPSDRTLTARLGAASGCAVVPISSHEFPDGESCFRLCAPPITGDAAIVAMFRAPNQTLAELLLLAEATRQWGAASVGLVSPYLPFMRQDAAIQNGEAVTARSFARILSRSFDWLITIDPHLHRIQRSSQIYGIPTRALHTAPLIGRWIANNVDHPFVVGPDVESRQWSDDIAAAARAPAVVLNRTRRGDALASIRLPDDVEEFRGRVPCWSMTLSRRGRHRSRRRTLRDIHEHAFTHYESHRRHAAACHRAHAADSADRSAAVTPHDG